MKKTDIQKTGIENLPVLKELPNLQNPVDIAELALIHYRPTRGKLQEYSSGAFYMYVLGRLGSPKDPEIILVPAEMNMIQIEEGLLAIAIPLVTSVHKSGIKAYTTLESYPTDTLKIRAALDDELD
ncbi:MAG: hypothetical protein AABZ92_07510 [Verrucomicrobiota bacterium]